MSPPSIFPKSVVRSIHEAAKRCPAKDWLWHFGKLCRLAERPFYAPLPQENLTDLQMLGKTFIKMSTGALETSQHLSSKDKKNFWRG